jgi:rubrerythrin
MYPTYIEVAKFQGETGAQKSFEWAYGMEKKHKEEIHRCREVEVY